MSTGFETMPSQFTKFWHAPVDPQDRFDPTFLGVPRKAKAVPHLTTQVERGKRIEPAIQAHDPKVFFQLPEQYKEPNFGSNVESNRFGNGFHRRGESSIQQDRLRVIKASDETARKEAAAAARRVRGANRNFSQFDTITGQPTPIVKFFPTATPTPSDRPEPVHKVMHWPETRQSSVFPSQQGVAGCAAGRSSVPLQTPTRRQVRLMQEGLTTTKKDWGVREQLGCNDGYVLPKI